MQICLVRGFIARIGAPAQAVIVRRRTQMKKSMLAGAAMIAVAAVAVPIMAWSADDNGADPTQAGQQWPHGGAFHGWMMRHWGRADFSPRQSCIERIARHAGFVAYMGARLGLTAEQKPLWDKVVAATQTAQDNQRQACAALKPASDDQVTLLDRMQQREQMLSARLQGLQQTEPAVRALYQALTPEQKTLLDHPFRRG
jgi:hypothetical protein